MKKLKIKFWKAERALAMQILEQEGLPKEKNCGATRINCSAFITDNYVSLRSDSRYDYDITMKTFDSNSDRDEHIDKIAQAITDELFTSNGELRVGEMCEMSVNKVVWERRIFGGKSAKQLGLDKRFLAVCNNDDYLVRYTYARPLTKRTEPKVEERGEIITYTWEE